MTVGLWSGCRRAWADNCDCDECSTGAIRRNDETPEQRAFWKRAAEASAEVATWPDWKRAGINVSDNRDYACPPACRRCLRCHSGECPPIQPIRTATPRPAAAAQSAPDGADPVSATQGDENAPTGQPGGLADVSELDGGCLEVPIMVEIRSLGVLVSRERALELATELLGAIGVEEQVSSLEKQIESLDAMLREREVRLVKSLNERDEAAARAAAVLTDLANSRAAASANEANLKVVLGAIGAESSMDAALRFAHLLHTTTERAVAAEKRQHGGIVRAEKAEREREQLRDELKRLIAEYSATANGEWVAQIPCDPVGAYDAGVGNAYHEFVEDLIEVASKCGWTL